MKNVMNEEKAYEAFKAWVERAKKGESISFTASFQTVNGGVFRITEERLIGHLVLE